MSGQSAAVMSRAEPHLVWPEDQAWCLACEVDEEIEFTVGCSGEASQALAGALPGAVRRVHYGEPAPLYRDPGLIPAPTYQAESDVGARARPGADRPVRHGAAVSPSDSGTRAEADTCAPGGPVPVTVRNTDWDTA